MAGRTILFAVATLVVVLLKPSPAAAQPAKQADVLIERGLEARAHQQDAEALVDFTLAYKTEPSPRALAQIALAEQALGRWPDAEKHLVEANQSDKDPWIEKHGEVLNRALRVIRDHLGTLEVRCAQPNAELQLNGVSVGTLPVAEQRVPVGSVLVEIRAAGFESYRQTVTIDPRQTLRITPELTPKREPAAAPLVAPATAVVSPVASPTSAPASPATVSVSPRTSERNTEDRHSARTSRRTLAWTLLAVGGGLLASAVTANVAREVSLGHYNDDRSCYYGTLSRMQRCGTSLGQGEVEGVVAIAAYTGAALAVGTSAYFFVTAQPAGQGGTAERWRTTASAGWSF